jgi:outer membrane protein assembly factor BamB
LAIRPGTTGGFIDVNGTEASSDPKLGIAWKSKRGTPKKPSLTLVDGLLFGVEDGGVATCWEAKTGAVLWSERLGGNYSASPLAGAGRLYCVGQEGQTVVIAAERTFRKLAENRLDKGSMASPAASDGALFVRTETHLYRLDDRSR